MSTTTQHERPSWTTFTRSSPQTDRWIVRGIVAVSALVAALTSSAEPTGLELADRAWCAAAVATVAYAASRSRRYPWLWLAGVTTAAAVGSWWVAAAMLALAGSLWGVFGHARNRTVGALVGALSGLTLLHLPVEGPHGLATVIAGVAVAPVLWSGFRHSPGEVKTNATRIAVVVGGCLVVFTLAFGISALLVRHQINSAVDQSRSGLDLIRDGDQEGGAADLRHASEEFGGAASGLSKIWALPARLVPVVGQQADALSTASAAGRDLTEAAEVAASTAPYRNLKSTGGAIDLATVAAMQEPTANTADALRHAADDVGSVQSSWLLPPVAAALSSFDDELQAALPEAALAEQSLAVAPELLGGNGTRNYLVLFTSPAESRNLGGFVGSYGILTAENGTVSFTVSGSITDALRESGVDPDTITLPDNAEFNTRYSRYEPTRHLQNLTVSPDMATDAEVSQSIFEQVTGIPIDGVMVVDPFGIAALLQLTGPVEVEGLDQPLTPENATDYLLNGQYIEYGDDQAGRKDTLEAAGRATFEALTSRDLPGPRALGLLLGPVVAEKHLMFYPFDPDARALLDRLHATGVFTPDLSGDFLSVRTADARANKIDFYLHRTIAYDTTYDPTTGSIRSTATVSLQNLAPADGLPDYILGSADQLPEVPRGTTTIRVAVYSPLLAVGATVDGGAVGIETQQELGAQVYSFLVTIPAGGTSALQVDLEGAISMGTDYQLQVLSQPMVNDDAFSLVVRSGSPDWTVAPGEGLTAGDGGATFSGSMTTDELFHAMLEPR